MPRKDREGGIEDQITAFAESVGWLVFKLVATIKGMPDRMFLRERGGEKRIVFIEVKRPGETPTDQQAKRHREMREHGAEVYWVDNVSDAELILS